MREENPSMSRLQDIVDEALAQMAAEHGGELARDDVNLAEFSRLTGLSRSKARTLKEKGFTVTPHGRCGLRKENTVIAGYTGVLDDLLRKGVTNSEVCFERIASLGYEGGVTTVKNYIAGRRDLVPAKRKVVEPSRSGRGERYSTEPGEAYQMDWGFVAVEDWRGEACRIACFAMVCHHCGTAYVEFFTNARQENLFIGMVHAFMAMGVPERVVTDNMKSVVTRRDYDGRPVWQADYASFMDAVGFKTTLCKPRHPFTKGKGRAPDTLREGQLPRRPRVHRHHPAQRRGPRMVRSPGREVQEAGRLRARRGARRQVPARRDRDRARRRDRLMPVPEAQDKLRRLRQLRGAQVRRAVLVPRQGLPRQPRGAPHTHLLRRPLPRARVPRGDVEREGQLLRRPVRAGRARGAADRARRGDGRAGRAAEGRPDVREVRLRGGSL